MCYRSPAANVILCYVYTIAGLHKNIALGIFDRLGVCHMCATNSYREEKLAGTVFGETVEE